ncbi:hypothetical protein CAPTEDRAFT_186353 [Capitella teleta]|uniref:Alkyl hydroperoxide reductase subunit C/ Thiol specific antioxidant domain-containing protein n=1 Tax=Capitella teleta TaxID=283909 RepID=R7TST0_CAPTE|nr:hypothetical protein CAPTEDRAFT_186353 [Capitella teleta]|eukprot:ELT96704.1 hypothetical protein CAPTEDRAFT_186353 [Capitella teleta]
MHHVCISQSRMSAAETLISALQALEIGIENVIEKAKCVLQEHSANEFAKSKAGVLGPMIGLYADCFKRVDVNNKDELESKIQKNFRSIDLQEQFTSFEETEAEFVAAGGHVVVVSFGVMEGAEKWLQEVNCPFEILLDPERKLYLSIGLGRSLSKVWNTETISYYGSQVKSQRKLPQAYKDIIDDPHQMGGDIVLNASGVIKMAYPSQKAQDRPSVQSLLDALSV